MKLKPIASNMTELNWESPDHITVLFSYQTPVAAYGLSRHGMSALVALTSAQARNGLSHIQAYQQMVGWRKASEVEQSVLDSLV